ncbi:MAG: proteasome accessory factor PafA2 family protein [Fimbriimonadaceae bacterium]|nr:proteasome accessory factor PafA2 family protein [Fimbriimonadaceae bacterium]
MTRPLLAGLDTEYGLVIEARSAENLLDDAREFVCAYPGEAVVTWDYRHESPRNDLRGFRLDALATDPEDAKFDAGRASLPAHVERADRILTTGGRLYNDHGHPEYATPECLTLDGLVRHDRLGERVMRQCADALSAKTGRAVRVYKNNTDFHGAAWGSHESYLVPREIGYPALFAAVVPMLVARLILTGAGKVGSETGTRCAYQLSQRADFIVEPANAETLYRRPLFNTRDEPHAAAGTFTRLHVIPGDSNMIPSATARKVGLVKLALALAADGEVPRWELADPVRAFQSVSRDDRYRFEIALKGGSWTTGEEILESYFSAAERTLELEPELQALIAECRQLRAAMRDNFAAFARHVDWAAKRRMLEVVMEAESLDWNAPSLRSYDMEYHLLDDEEGLFPAMEAEGMVEAAALTGPDDLSPEPSRALVRSLAVRHFPLAILTAGWRSLTMRHPDTDAPVELDLPPDRTYAVEPDALGDVRLFIQAVQALAAR